MNRLSTCEEWCSTGEGEGELCAGTERPLVPDSSYQAWALSGPPHPQEAPGPYHLLLELPDSPLGLPGFWGRKD